jgi:hypothetical protein
MLVPASKAAIELKNPIFIGVPCYVSNQPGRHRVGRFAFQRITVVSDARAVRNFPDIVIGNRPHTDKFLDKSQTQFARPFLESGKPHRVHSAGKAREDRGNEYQFLIDRFALTATARNDQWE